VQVHAACVVERIGPTRDIECCAIAKYDSTA
jgi:hypothetical protein